jgi:hypothetical protein
MANFDTLSFMGFSLTSGTITNGVIVTPGTLTELSPGGVVSSEDINFFEFSGNGGSVADTLESGELFDDTGAVGGELANNFYYVGYVDSGQAAGRLFLFQDQGNPTLFIAASLVDLPSTFPDGTPGSFPTTIDTSTIVTSDFPYCLKGGSMIATPDGERAVEALRIGDLVLTADGHAVPVTWIGRQHVPFPTMMSKHLEPVLVTAEALGDGLPHSDLYVSADHGIVLNGMVVNASALVNGTTIRFAASSEPYTYYHVETDQHDVILANGLSVETFIDVASRSSFDNYQEYLDRFGTERLVPGTDMPRVSSARLLPEAIKALVRHTGTTAQFDEAEPVSAKA